MHFSHTKSWYATTSCSTCHSVFSRPALVVGGSSFWWNGQYPGVWAPWIPSVQRGWYLVGYSDTCQVSEWVRDLLLLFWHHIGNLDKETWVSRTPYKKNPWRDQTVLWFPLIVESCHSFKSFQHPYWSSRNVIEPYRLCIGEGAESLTHLLSPSQSGLWVCLTLMVPSAKRLEHEVGTLDPHLKWEPRNAM